MTAAQSLSQRFFSADSTDITVVADSRTAGAWAERNGYEFLHISQALERNVERCVLIGTTKFWYSELTFLRDALKSAAVLWLPLGAFDGSEEAVGYGLGQLDKVDWRSTSAKQYQVEAMIDNHRGYRISDRDGRRLSIEMPAETGISAGPPGALEPGDFQSLVAHLEVETEYIAEGSEPLGADGEIGIDSLLFALGPRTVMAPAERRLASDLCARVGACGDAVLIARNGYVSGFRVGGDDLVTSLADLAGEVLGTKISEFSFGLNSDLSDMHWGLNSPLNEGAEGIHLGLGDGYTGVHLDFVVSGATIEPAAI